MAAVAGLAIELTANTAARASVVIIHQAARNQLYVGLTKVEAHNLWGYPHEACGARLLELRQTTVRRRRALFQSGSAGFLLR